MKRLPSAATASLGVSLTRLAVEQELGWLFREQPTEDYGIDAQVEVVDQQRVEGRLVAFQIKAGPSYFRSRGESGWWFRPDMEHVNYWLRHSLPVAVILCDPETKCCYWQLVNEGTLQTTSSGGKRLLVPESQPLDASAADALRAAAQGDPYELTIRSLRLARPWMDLLRAGTRLVIDIAEWINKTSGRGSIYLGIDQEDGNDPTPIASWGVMLGMRRYAEVVPELFPWADVEVHEETYDWADHDQWEAECVFYDEGDRYVSESYEEWATTQVREQLRPYSNAAGEVDNWRLELRLNDLGHAFLRVDDFAAQHGFVLTPID